MLQSQQKEAQLKDDSVPLDEDEEDDDDEPTIIKMLESMLPRKLLLSELLAMNNEVSVEELKAEIKNRFFKDIAAKQQKIMDDEWSKRAARLDKLLDKIIQKKLRMETEYAEQRAIEAKQKLEKEQM